MTSNDAPVLVIDDEPSICWGFEQMLGDEGYRVLTASSAEEGLQLARQTAPAMVVLDVRLPGEDGLTALPRFQELIRGAPVVVITAFGDLETAVRAMRDGAADYLTKPFRLEDAVRICRQALQQSVGPAAAPQAPPAAAGGNRLVGRSAAMQQVYRQIAMVAESDLSVLITGETGTGKELIAAAIHENSRRREGPYLPIAPVALNPSLVESDLFGHVRGAFTGANERREGLFALADGGTVLLDEIGDLPLAVQVKLLRVLEQRQYTPVGDVRPRSCDVRILAATHRDLKQASAARAFREDLFYRLAAVEIHAPSLRDRLDDLEMLVAHFLQLAGHPDPHAPLAPAVLEELRNRPWYGNVRELRNAIEHAVVVGRGRPLAAEHLPPPQPPRDDGTRRAPDALAEAVRAWTRRTLDEDSSGANLQERLLQEVEPPLLEIALETTGGNRAAAADLLGMHRATLRERLRRYRLTPNTDPQK